jgi:hypothetical protein
MSDDQIAPKTTNRPSKRRGFKPGLVAAAIAGALLVPAAAVTIAAQPWADESAVAVGAYADTDDKDTKTAEEAEAELRECVQGMDLNISDANDIDIATLVKAMRCLELVDSVGGPDSPLTEKEAQQLVEQGLKAVEAAGFDREQLPGVLSVLSDTGLVKPLAGERANNLVTLMAESKALEDYANREIERTEASQQIAEVLVTLAAKDAEQASK